MLTRGAGCVPNIEYCIYVSQQQGSGSGTELAQKWIELQTNPDIFESEGSGTRCLDNFNGDESSGSQVILFPYSSTDNAQQWQHQSSQ